MQLHSACLTDIGRTRETNQDSYVCKDSLKLYAVADGLGGHVGGEVAARMAITVVERAFVTTQRSFDPASYLVKVVQQTNRLIYEKSQATPSLRGMGTTLTVLYFSFDSAYIAHVGDSRAYLIQNGMIWQLSEDHALMSQQMVSGMPMPLKNVLTRSVGYDPQVEVDLYTKKVSEGDVYLLCSDGLHGFVKDEEMVDIISTSALDSAVKKLVQLANKRGGEDNITVVLCEVKRL